VTGWQYQALKAAKNPGVKIHNLHKASTRVVNYLSSTQAKDGGFEGANRDADYWELKLWEEVSRDWSSTKACAS